MKQILVVLLALSLLSVSALAAPKALQQNRVTTVYLIEKDPTTWEPTYYIGSWGKLSYEAGKTYSFTGHGLRGEYQLINYGGWNNVQCLGVVGTPECIGIMKASGPMPSTLLVDYSDPMGNYGIKFWLVPSSAVDCAAGAMLQWTPETFLFENTLVPAPI